MKRLLLFFTIISLSGCAAQRPVLYPNAYYNSVGRVSAESDISNCIVLANDNGAGKEESIEIVKGTARGGVLGGATGAATGAIFGRAGTGAAAGAAGGGVAGLTNEILSIDQPSQVFKSFVDKCLADRGYDPIGWN